MSDVQDDQLEKIHRSVMEEPTSADSIEETIVDPLIGTTLGGRYEVLMHIGAGATSTVYKARDKHLDCWIAVKILHHHLVSDVEIVQRFQQEVKTSSLLRHANIVAVHDFNKTATGDPYLVMDYVDGKTLQQIAHEAGGWLPCDRACNIFMQVCAALGAAHEKRIVHRDIKPSNIMITQGPDGQDFVRVLDFGIAKIISTQSDTFLRLTQTGQMLGSLLYMSPEQCLDTDLDGRSDVYSLGCVMYEMLTGKPPLCGRTAFETMNDHLTKTPESFHRVRPDLNLPINLQKVLFKAFAKAPDQRFQTIGELADALRSIGSYQETTEHRGSEARLLPGGPVPHKLAVHQRSLPPPASAADSQPALQSSYDLTQYPQMQALVLDELSPGEKILWAGPPCFCFPDWVSKVLPFLALWAFVCLVTLFYSPLLTIWAVGLSIVVALAVGSSWDISDRTLLCFTDRRFLRIRLKNTIGSSVASTVVKPQKEDVISIDYAAMKGVKIMEERDGVGKLVYLAKVTFPGTGQLTEEFFVVEYVPNPRQICAAIPVKIITD